MSSTETQPTTPTWALGERMEKAREFAAIDRDEMARRLGVTERTIRNYENEAVKVSRSTVIAYAMETHVPLDWFEDDLRSRCALGGAFLADGYMVHYPMLPGFALAA